MLWSPDCQAESPLDGGEGTAQRGLQTTAGRGARAGGSLCGVLRLHGVCTGARDDAALPQLCAARGSTAVYTGEVSRRRNCIQSELRVQLCRAKGLNQH